MQSPTTSAAGTLGWNQRAQAQWMRGERQAAIDSVLAVINQYQRPKPLKLVLQLAYYVFLCGDPRGAAVFLEDTRRDYPDDADLLLNLSVCLSRSGQYEPAVARMRECLRSRPDDPVAYDGLAASLYQLGRHEEAAQAGTRALVLKDSAIAPPPPDWRLPAASPRQWPGLAGKRDVVSFSLWGRKQRYLRGALENALAAPTLYPGWTFVFFVDESVPEETRQTLSRLGAELRQQPADQPMRDRLAWRFQVANEPDVGRFLVRDVDSVVSERERSAVDAWLRSDCWFHAMRDWWTHTDLLLAGMWGGVAGVLPDLRDLLANYRPAAMETPNVDQWFLRDRVWSYVRTSCLVHDRCFSPPGAVPWPQPPTQGFHVGQNEFAVRRHEQEQRIATVLGTKGKVRAG
ncbi:MAG TPA: tetratricopeptide repeat protein [Ramlibacter sp.]|uniref:tetratricopeptide repeat protein n=1 Tax=Ramlibacter sp. TaxID=1917967 RepID=UPI002C36D542|nr:tetratricopeptide repeat protein [Ramlibacter sp.]HVZ42242.1 tetratricopeptide repeat protein [Ramlibacter sp.]